MTRLPLDFKTFSSFIAIAGTMTLVGFGCRTLQHGSALKSEIASLLNIATFPAEYSAKRQIVAVKRNGQTVDLTTTSLPIKIDILREDLLKVRLANRKSFDQEYTWSVSETFKAMPVAFKLTESPDVITIETSQMIALITRASGAISLSDKSGREVLKFDGLFADAYEDSMNQAPGRAPQKRLLLGAKFAMHADDHFFGLGEKLRGKFDQSLDWRGKRRDWEAPGSSMGNHFEGSDGGANGNVLIPFLLTTRGAGLFLDTVYHTYWEFDDPSQSSWYVKQDCDQDWEKGSPKCERSEMRFYMMVGTKPGTVINRYTDITGKPLMPPRWMLGYLQSNYGYRNWAEVEKVADGLQKDGFALDGIFLDLQWFGGVPGVYSETGQVTSEFSDCQHRQVGSFKWGKDKEFNFEHPREAMARLGDKGIKVVPIEEGYIDTCNNRESPYSQNFEEAKNAGFLARRNFDSNDPALFANGDDNADYAFGAVGYFGQVGMIDTSNAAARQWFWSKHLPILLDGASAFWTDLGEPERFRWWWKYDGGLWHQDIHNVWDMNRARSFYEGYTIDLPNKRPFILSRSGYAGSQRFGVGIWSADAPARLGWAAAQPSAHMNLAISGVPYSTSDVGGFGGFPVSNGKQYTRWLQMESFSSLLRAHGNTTVGENTKRIVHPNGFGEPYTSINRKYINWRESLIPYIYTHAREAFDTGMPIVRALPLVWTKDSNVQDLGSEFLLGPSILVAPILLGSNNEPDTQRDVYLPAGDWVDLHDGKFYKGSQWLRNFAAPLEKMPVFALKGAIIPKAPTSTSVSDKRWNATRIFEIYPANTSTQYDLYDDDGDSNAYRDGTDGFAKTTITVEPTNSSVSVKIGAMKGNFPGMPLERVYALEVHLEKDPQTVNANGQVLPIKETTEAGTSSLTPGTALWNPQQKKLLVVLSATSTNTELTFHIAF
ncbi:MAG: glycoside hydrolase family 31 protein [Chitinophagaceae bacterium]|nr:glycoside hydrolase family 31 protein [Oligoflexus sp.]